jgi:hypothetical protein
MRRLLCVSLILALPLAVLLAAPPADEPKPPVPINLDKINTKADEDDPHLASDGKTFYYSSTANGKSDLWLARRSSPNQAWSAGKLVPDLNSKAETRSVFVTPEGVFPQRLYFATNKDLEKKSQKGDNFDLYFVTKQGPSADFTFETALPFCTAEDEMHPWLTAQGQFYFSRKTKEGWRVFVATRPKSGGQFGEPVLLKDLPPDFQHVTLTPDGKTMYLEGPLDNGRTGLFHCTATGVNSWSKPEPLADLNSSDAPTSDRSPSLSRDGTMLYFASDRPGGKGGLDLYVVPTKDLAKKGN